MWGKNGNRENMISKDGVIIDIERGGYTFLYLNLNIENIEKFI